MDGQAKLVESARHFLERRDTLYEAVANSPQFRATGAGLYGNDSVNANFSIILELLAASGSSDFLTQNGIQTVIDLGGANGDLTFIFDGVGFETTLVDRENSYENGPLVASLINAQLGANARVIDRSIDGYFSYNDLLMHTVNSGQFRHRSETNSFDLAICLGLLYHLKNPYAFLESISRLCRYCILGTWLMSYYPDNITSVRDVPIAYLLGHGELNNDASNYWIFTEKSFRRLAERTGFSIISSVSAFVREDKISNPVDPNYGERGHLLLRSEHVA